MPDPAFDFERFIPPQIAIASFRIGLIGDALARQLGLARPMVRLMLILNEKDKHRISKLAERAGMRVSIVSRLLYALERRGLIRHDRPGGGDARAVTVELTEAGRAVAARCVATAKRLDALLATGLTAEERLVFLGLLRRLMDNVPLAEAEYAIQARGRAKR